MKTFKIFFLLFILTSFYIESKIPEKVLICGVCKNAHQYLKRSKKIMEKIGSFFDDYRILIYENNSTDSTPKILKKWQQVNPKVHIESEVLSFDDFYKYIINQSDLRGFCYTETIARARNKVLDIAMLHEYDAFHYIIWMDMDFVIPPKLDGMVEVFESKRDWDAILAYGINPRGIYFDWYALRDKQIPIGPEMVGDEWWSMGKNCILSQYDDWYPVFSAFGGFGIYKKSSILGCRYSGIVTPDLESLSKEIISNKYFENNSFVIKYFDNTRNLSKIIKIDLPTSSLPKIKDSNTGIILNNDLNPIFWRLNTWIYQYPHVCEHVTFHASMKRNGHDKIFINPRIVFYYR